VTSRAARFAAVSTLGYALHTVADHWVQTDRQACATGKPGKDGALACAAHVATYTAVNAGGILALNRALGLGLTWRGILTGQAISAATHYWADRRYTLEALADATGNGDFYRLGEYLGKGSYALDQSWHIGWLAVAALATAIL
jgi:hypothetical protein